MSSIIFCIFPAFIGMASGLYLNSIGFAFYNQTSMMWVFLLCQFGGSLQQTIFWLTPPFIIQILINHFKVRCNSEKNDLFEDCRECIDIFDAYSKSFRIFLLIYFIFNQSFAIFYIFSSFITMMRPDFLSLQGAFVGTIGQWVNIFFVIFALLIITGAIDDSFESLQGLKRPIQEQLLKSNEQLEKIYLE